MEDFMIDSMQFVLLSGALDCKILVLKKNFLLPLEFIWHRIVNIVSLWGSSCFV